MTTIHQNHNSTHTNSDLNLAKLNLSNYTLPPNIANLLNLTTESNTTSNTHHEFPSIIFDDTSNSDDLDLFLHCWMRPSCPSCLSPTNPYPCSWCETSQTCVPNTIYPYPFGILSPIKSSTICPLGWRERWEMRARPFSCRCSSMTFISVVVAVLVTLGCVLGICMAVKLGRWVRRKVESRSTNRRILVVQPVIVPCDPDPRPRPHSQMDVERERGGLGQQHQRARCPSTRSTTATSTSRTSVQAAVDERTPLLV
ncbi:hypothetical protein HRR86_009607 [Exophiala dermatitidis]|uniref:PSI domain-containing protein n=1 Tax=Exophiala dermatitidis (strain ATCC 34100 / CBS 525.76 / NIH/UT8656) TaxID=858893 RepID=H6BWP1_EXODN|nr:uncharacterized protein HMPREF1120_04202 [Exophiala dermatitidis NIH/UT8656]EHY56102.1 hypothetical protein HMPREF1120_04202 [Exophiala dermatitidis NIH/UT8656]KAJ4541021.1 hypothetical protein HRR76_009596 [Exophiala dermatitidis]KAJ4574325.1 hypothetical protein HRR82_009593 [Exophiala dermatitidis]KAJ4618583.1 hypothetical protein HRR86_009607 [Exophiala dermatitidis]